MIASRVRLARLHSLRSFSCTAKTASSSPLFNLTGLSTSRESQWLSKASGLSRIEHSPGLQLLRSEAELQRATSLQNPRPSERSDGTSNVARPPVLNAEPIQRVTTPLTESIRPWVGKVRRDLDDLERAVQNYGPAVTQTNAGWMTLEKSYMNLLAKQKQTIETLNAALKQDQAKYEKDRQRWDADETMMRDHIVTAKNEANRAFLILWTVLIVNMIMGYHILWKPVPSGDSKPAAPAQPKEHASPSLDTSNEPALAPAAIPLHDGLRTFVDEPQSSELRTRGFFWSR